jgi:hypothetical protein
MGKKEGMKETGNKNEMKAKGNGRPHFFHFV